ncbi:MAG: pyrroline-5-carboxylate reductase [Spirochaetia bacterium]|nr:pyrroline-5-carboxylate reductase [Spirochaetia bacterium]
MKAKKNFSKAVPVKIGFLGAGNMAQAIMNGLVNSGMKKGLSISAYDINAAAVAAVSAKYGAKPVASAAELVEGCRVVILAVKPQNFAELFELIKGSLTSKHLLISIAAGISTQKISSLAGKKAAIVRVMPNTPALVGMGAAGYSFTKAVGPADKKMASQILSTFCSAAIELPEEKLNAVTALSGSGPAYVFYFAEAMLKAADELGLNAADAKKLVIHTFKGSAELMEKSQETPAQLRIKVTSKGGTTQRALDVMESAGVAETVRLAVRAAKERADELGK